MPAALALFELEAEKALLDQVVGRSAGFSLRSILDADIALVKRECETKAVVSAHGGAGVISALEQALRDAGFESSELHSLVFVADGLSAYQQELVTLLPQIEERALVERLLLAFEADEAERCKDPRAAWRAVSLHMRVPTVVLAGVANAGKSTLFNALTRQDAAIISAEAGTTRDTIDAVWQLGAGCHVRLIDSPGLRAATDIDSPGEVRGIEIGRGQAEVADLTLYLVAPGDEAPTGREKQLIVFSKADVEMRDGICVSVSDNSSLETLAQIVRRTLFPRLPEGLLPISEQMANTWATSPLGGTL